MPGLKELREQKFMTTRELAQKASVSSRTINRLEYGIGTPYFSTLKRIADALGVDPNIIVCKPSNTDIVPINISVESLRQEFEKTIEVKILEALNVMNNQTEAFQHLFTQKLHDMGKRVITNENMLRALLAVVMSSTSGSRDKFVDLFNKMQKRDNCDPVAIVTKDGNLRLVDRSILESESHLLEDGE